MTRVGGTAPLLIGAALAVCGCNPDEFDPFNRLTGLRVLAVASDPVAPAAGETTLLTPLVYQPPGQGPPTFRWSWCPFPADASDGFRCGIDEADLAKLGGGGPVPSFDLGTAPTASFMAGIDPAVLAVICAGVPDAPALPDCEGGFPVQIQLRVRADEAEVNVVRTLRVRFEADGYANTNPVIDGLSAHVGGADAPLDVGAPVLLDRDEETKLNLDVSIDHAEIYTGRNDKGEQGTQRERLVATWFVESGDTKYTRTGFIDGTVPLKTLLENRWTPAKRKDYSRGTADVIVVLRDNREGVSWRRGSVQLSEGP